MELRELASFLAVVEEGRFARAAERLFLSPPAVTGHVARLERELGVRLLERSPLRLTEAGERFVPHARAALAAVNAAADSVTGLGPDGADPVLRVGVMGHGSGELTPAIIHAFRQARPLTRVHIEPLDFTEHVSALARRKVDVAFVRPAPDDDRVDVDVLTTEPRIVIVPAASPLAAASSARLSDVLDLPFLALPPATPKAFRDYLYFSSARGDAGLRRSPDQARNPHEALASVAAGRATGSALASFARFYSWPGVRYLPIVDAPWDSSVLTSRRGDPSAEVRAFRALAAAIARDLGPALQPRPGDALAARPGRAPAHGPGDVPQVVRGAPSGLDSLGP